MKLNKFPNLLNFWLRFVCQISFYNDIHRST